MLPSCCGLTKVSELSQSRQCQVLGPMISTVAPVQTTRHRCARNRRKSQQKTLGKSASKQSAAGSASTRLGAVATNALLCVLNVARKDTSQHHEVDTELYERIRKESRKRKGSSASGPFAAKRSKSVPAEEKDLENQLKKAHLSLIHI